MLLMILLLMMTRGPVMTAADTLDRRRTRAGDSLVVTPPGPGRGRQCALFAAGAVAAMFAVGGRWDIAIAAWIAPVLLLRFSRVTRPAVAIVAMWLVSVAAALSWIWQMSPPGVVTRNWTVYAGWMVFGTVLAVPYILDRLLLNRTGVLGRMTLFPATLAACQFLLAVVNPFGTAYGLSAVTQREYLGLLQVISITGPYAVAFLIGWFATAVNALWDSGWTWRRAGQARIGILAAAVTIAGILGAGGARLGFASATGEPTVTVAGISPSSTGRYPASSLADPVTRDGFAAAQANLFTATTTAARAGAKIVMWSENAAPVLEADRDQLLAEAAALARREHIYLLVADRVYSTDGPGQDETNLIDPDGRLRWTYQKAHPIPGLEAYPPGDGEVPVIDTPYGRLASVICFDADFPALARVDADIMLVPGAEWPAIGRTHTGMAGLRAIENGYSLVRQSYQGESGAFDYTGRTLATQDSSGTQQRMMLVDVPTQGVSTTYRHIGDAFAWLCLAATLTVIAIALRRRT